MNYIERTFNSRIPKLGKYGNGRIAVVYVNPEEHDDDIIATVNIPEAPLKEDEVIIKDYSENEGMFRAMYKAGHIGPELRRVSSGWITAPVVKLLIQPTVENQYTG